MIQPSRILRASWAAPISGPPIQDAEVVIMNDRIIAVRPATTKTADFVDDYGEAVILPGLVNVHTHLDYTVMRGLLEDLEFFPWIRELTARASTFLPEDWLASARWGAAEAIAGGVTTIGDCTFSGAAFDAARQFGLSGVIYQEVFGIDGRNTVGETISELTGKVERMEAESVGSLLHIGISPHAPYTVRHDLFRGLAAYAKSHELAICIHAAESQSESELLRSGTGLFADMYARRGIDWAAPGTSTVAYLDTLGILGPRTLLVHGVQISASDLDVIRERGVAWAHCPKSNAKLGAGVAPLGLLRDVALDGSMSPVARVGLGSDSVASNNAMDLFEEMRFAVLMQRGARRRIASLSAADILEMATLGGARALGLESEIGTLEPGKRADICVVRLGDLHSAPAYDPISALVYSGRASDVIATYVAGEARYDVRLGPRLEHRFPENDVLPIREQLNRTAQKMREWRATT